MKTTAPGSNWYKPNIKRPSKVGDQTMLATIPFTKSPSFQRVGPEPTFTITMSSDGMT
ncbi:MAG: hypothetical protein ACI82I_000882 [Gammaproteobacteria bacterium]|jgi:hypothetical protein